MNRILTCPHCGPTLTEARLRCDRCGRELVYISEAEFSGRDLDGDAAGQKPSVARRASLWASVAAAAIVVVALAGLRLPWRDVPGPAPEAGSMTMAAQSPAILAAPSNAPVVRGEAPAPDAVRAASKPGDLGEALAHYRAALAEKPADPELMGNVGQILVAMNRPGEAVPFLEKAVEAEPFAIIARFDLAVAYSRSGKPKEAAEQYEALVQSGSTDSRVYHNLGLALRRLGRNADAAAAFDRATALAPERAPGWLGLALSLEADGRAVEAATALERYLSLEPSGPDADNVRARIARLRAAAAPVEAQPDGESGASRR
jgi:predicted Zn-dependent protease